MSSQYEWVCKLTNMANDLNLKFIIKYRDVERKGQEGRWKEFDENATSLTKIFDRTRLPNEIVFDFDSDDEKQDLDNIEKVSIVLKNEGIPYIKNDYVNDEGKKGAHLHIFFKVSGSAVEGGFSYDRYRELFFNTILKKANVDKEKSRVDHGLVNDKSHLVREFKENFPNEVPVWDVSDDYIRETIEHKLVNDPSNQKSESDDTLYYFDEDDTSVKNYLDVGIANGHLYYGKLTHGKETIVLDDHRALRNNRIRVKDEDEGWVWEGENEVEQITDYVGYIGDIMPRWSNKKIQSFLKGSTVEKNTTTADITKWIDFLMDFGENMDGAVEVQTCWVIGTYIYPIFYWYPHLLFYGPRESGKTKNAKTLMFLSFGGYRLGVSSNVTPATIYNTLDGNRGTTILDEYEKIENNENQAVMNQILNCSAERDATIIKNVQVGKDWRPKKFPIYSPKIVCNITGIDETSLTRFITFHMLKTLTEKGDKKPEHYKKELSFLRDDLHILMLQHWKEIRDIYENLTIEGISNRNADNWKPIIAIARWLGGNFEMKVMTYYENLKEVVVDAGDIEADVFYTLYDKVADEVQRYSVKDIASWCESLLSHIKSPERWLGRRLTRYKFKPIRLSSGVHYELSRALVKNRVLDRYFPTKETTQTTLTTLTTQTPQTTQTTQYNENHKDGGENTEKSSAVNVVNEDEGIAKHSIKTALDLVASRLKKDGTETANFSILVLDAMELNPPVDSDILRAWLEKLKFKGYIYEPKHGEFALRDGVHAQAQRPTLQKELSSTSCSQMNATSLEVRP